ncbi:MAG: endonuclease/exonuclease/phosphatase family protein [Conexibacter sp.]|nr:endonuclease/exonuclease/phosphatase family protein [Conexibacter sp.]
MVVLAPWLAWAAIRTLGLEGGTRLVPLMTFTPYVGLTAPVPLVAALLLRRWVVAAVALAVVAAFALALLPRALDGPQPDVAAGATVHAMTANLFEGAGDARTIVALVRRQHVDVLALEELTPEEVARLDRAGLGRVLRHRDVDARPGASGTGLYSRWPLRRRDPYNQLDRNGEPRALVAVPGAAPIDVQAIHPPPPLHGQTTIWRTMLGELPAPGRGQLRMLMGDFNATLDHRQLRRLLGGDDGYVDAADATGQGYDTTWPAGRDFPPEITIDHVLIDPRMAATAVSVHLVPRSDHRAVIATLRVPGVARVARVAR